MELLIRSLGHETISAEDGMEGWEIWKNEKTRMVITDWVMPEMDGIDLVEKIITDIYSYIIAGSYGGMSGTIEFIVPDINAAAVIFSPVGRTEIESIFTVSVRAHMVKTILFQETARIIVQNAIHIIAAYRIEIETQFPEYDTVAVDNPEACLSQGIGGAAHIPVKSCRRF